MTHTTQKAIKTAYNEYLKSDRYFLTDCYDRMSEAKRNAWRYCEKLFIDYGSGIIKILGFNTFQFSVGFVGWMGDRKAFFYITRDYDRYIYLDEIIPNGDEATTLCEIA